MNFMLALFLLSQSAFAIDTGDGSDGVCNISGGADTQITSARTTYQCKSLNIDANLNDFKGGIIASSGSPLIIKVQEEVTIQAGVTVDFSGENGGDGLIGGAVTGGRAGAGGSSGGSGTATNGSSGSGTGAGAGGDFATRTGAASSFGGGGGGGSYKTVGTAATDGDDNGTIISAGVNGSVYGPESAFDTSFTGGSGGGAGGSGIDGASASWLGSAGGGGGGALRIIAGGNITVHGSILANGGDGGGDVTTTTSSGGGGGASGGAIWLQSAGTLTVSNTGVVSAVGGFGGENTSGFAGFGGNGGDGRIRLDDSDGVITTIAGSSITPNPYSTTFSPTALPTTGGGTNAVGRQYNSSVSCAKVSLDEKQPFFLINLIAGFLAVGLIHLSLSRKSKV